MPKVVKKPLERQGDPQLLVETPNVAGRALHELIVGAGLQVLAAMLEAERERLRGRRYGIRRVVPRTVPDTRQGSLRWAGVVSP